MSGARLLSLVRFRVRSSGEVNGDSGFSSVARFIFLVMEGHQGTKGEHLALPSLSVKSLPQRPNHDKTENFWA